MLTTTYGPGDEITWPFDPADDVDIGASDIRDVIAQRVRLDPVGRSAEMLMSLMAEEGPLDEPELLDTAIVYLTQHMADADFPLDVREALDAAFQAIADQTDTRYELQRARQRQIADALDL